MGPDLSEASDEDASGPVPMRAVAGPAAPPREVLQQHAQAYLQKERKAFRAQHKEARACMCAPAWTEAQLRTGNGGGCAQGCGPRETP